MKEFLFFFISILTALFAGLNCVFCDLKEVTFFNPPDALCTISYQELYNSDGNLIAVKTYYYRAKNPRILDMMVITGPSRNTIRVFNCDFFGVMHNPRYLCLDGDANIIMEDEKAKFVQPFPAVIPAVTKNFYSAGVLIKTVKMISVCSNALRGTGLTNCRYVW
jgi:hypothetical protein